jgi:hypothetical protein
MEKSSPFQFFTAVKKKFQNKNHLLPSGASRTCDEIDYQIIGSVILPLVLDVRHEFVPD